MGDSWQGIYRLKEYRPVLPSLLINIGASYYVKKRLGINLDVFLYKELNDFDRFPGNPFLFFGVGAAYDF